MTIELTLRESLASETLDREIDIALTNYCFEAPRKRYKSKHFTGVTAVIVGVRMLGDIALVQYMREQDGAYETETEVSSFMRDFYEMK